MVCLKNCQICGISVLDKNLCSKCMEAVSSCALQNIPIDREQIKKEVIDKRMEESQEELRRQLKAMHTCPQCGHEIYHHKEVVMFLEIRNQEHLMDAEGSADTKPSEEAIRIAIKNRGYIASNISIFLDCFQGMWRFNADIREI